MPFLKINTKDRVLIAEAPASPLDSNNNDSDSTISNEQSEFATYAYTIAVAPTKVIDYRRKRDWSKYSNAEQKELLDNIIQPALFKLKIMDSEYKFELTKAGNIHVHGLFYTTDDNTSCFQAIIHKKLGLPKAGADRVCMIVRTIVDQQYWITYMNKDQGAIL